MDEAKNQKREADSCNYASAKRAKSSDDQDSESISIGSFSGSNSYSPRDSGYRDTVIRSGSGSGSGSGEDSLCLDQNARNADQNMLPGRVRILEEKVNWIGRELQLIREMLQFITKMMPFGSCLPHFISNETGVSLQRKNGPIPFISGDSLCDQNGYSKFKDQIDYSKFREPSDFSKFKDLYSQESVPASPEKQRKLAKDLQVPEKEQEIEEGQSNTFDKRGESPGSQNSAEANDNEREQHADSKPTRMAGVNISRLLLEVNSAIDIIQLWEHGTPEMLPIKSWNADELTDVGEKLTIWKHIVALFKEDCAGDMETFIRRYSDSEGNVMSVPEIAARSHLGRKSSSNSVSADYQRAKEMTCSSEVQSVDNSTGKPNSHNWLERSKQRMPYFILPRKINGRKVSAKDVIRIWEYGQGRIPPVKIWTSNQKLRQQSKISRWKKIVDIFKSDCNGDMKEFEMRYSNGCGTLLPIAAIIAKFEQKQSSFESLKQATMSNLESFTYPESHFNQSDDTGNDVTNDNFEQLNSGRKAETHHKELNVEGEEHKTMNPNYFKQMINARHSVAHENRRQTQKHDGVQEAVGVPRKQVKLDPKEFIWKEMLSCYSKEEFCREYINRRSSVEEALLGEHGVKVMTSKYSGFDESITAGSEEHCAIQDKVMKEDQEDMQRPPFKKSCSDDQGAIVKINRSGPLTANVEKINIKEAQLCNQDKPLICSPSVETGISQVEGKAPSELQVNSCNQEMEYWRKSSGHYDIASQSLLKNHIRSYGAVGPGGVNVEGYYPVPMEKMNTKNDLDETQQQMTLPDTNDALEVISLWETGNERFPPLALMLDSRTVRQHPKLSTWKQFMEIFNHVCGADKIVLHRKFADEEGHLLPVTEIVNRHFRVKKESYEHESKAAPDMFYSTNTDRDISQHTPLDATYVLPRKINGRKVSAKDVIYIWNHGFKDMPPVKSWLPHQKIRQQSKISRWKKIAEIFETDCNKDIEIFEKKYSNKANELLPIAAIIAKYDAEENPEGLTNRFHVSNDSNIHSYQKASLV